MKIALNPICGVQRRRRGAFTFVEVMMATAITLVMFVTFYTAMLQEMQIVRVSRENLRATQIMVGRMEGIRLFTFSQLTDTNLMPTNFIETYYPSGLSNSGTNGYQGIIYTGAITVCAANFAGSQPSYSNNLYQVTIQLNWNSSGVTRTRQMTTYCGQYGMQNYVWSNPN